jgi:hypothetical protein
LRVPGWSKKEIWSPQHDPCALRDRAALHNYMMFVIIVHAVYVNDMMGREYNDYFLNISFMCVIQPC